jgi:hypothetical protein
MDKPSTATPEAGLFDGAEWFDPIEIGIRDRVRGFIEGLLEEELTAALGSRPGAAIYPPFAHGGCLGLADSWLATAQI